jgi:hypothetical protein
MSNRFHWKRLMLGWLFLLEALGRLFPVEALGR